MALTRSVADVVNDLEIECVDRTLLELYQPLEHEPGVVGFSNPAGVPLRRC